MPFITKSTFSKIVGSVDLDCVGYPKKSNLENIDLWLLSKREKQRLILVKQLFQDGELFINKLFFKLKTPVDSLTMVYPERSPSYHKTINCKALNREYENFQIPAEIRERGVNEVKKFRNWFSLNSDKLSTNLHGFHRELTQEFKLKNEPEYLARITTPNSGAGQMQNTNISEVEKQLDELLKSAEEYKNKSPEIRLTINKYGYKSHCPPEEESYPEENKIIRVWHQRKTDIKKIVFLYFMIKFNPDLKMSENILDSLGLKKCPLCYKDKDQFFDLI